MRRPNFLRHLPKDQYVEYYKALVKLDADDFAALETPDSFTKSMMLVGWALSNILRHIIFRFDPEFVVPIDSRVVELKTYDVEARVGVKAFPAVRQYFQMASESDTVQYPFYSST